MGIYHWWVDEFQNFKSAFAFKFHWFSHDWEADLPGFDKWLRQKGEILLS